MPAPGPRCREILNEVREEQGSARFSADCKGMDQNSWTGTRGVWLKPDAKPLQARGGACASLYNGLYTTRGHHTGLACTWHTKHPSAADGRPGRVVRRDPQKMLVLRRGAHERGGHSRAHKRGHVPVRVAISRRSTPTVVAQTQTSRACGRQAVCCTESMKWGGEPTNNNPGQNSNSGQDAVGPKLWGEVGCAVRLRAERNARAAPCVNANKLTSSPLPSGTVLRNVSWRGARAASSSYGARATQATANSRLNTNTAARARGRCASCPQTAASPSVGRTVSCRRARMPTSAPTPRTRCGNCGAPHAAQPPTQLPLRLNPTTHRPHTRSCSPRLRWRLASLARRPLPAPLAHTSSQSPDGSYANLSRTKLHVPERERLSNRPHATLQPARPRMRGKHACRCRHPPPHASVPSLGFQTRPCVP